jgi:MscS family membrane protein
MAVWDRGLAVSVRFKNALRYCLLLAFLLVWAVAQSQPAPQGHDKEQTQGGEKAGEAKQEAADPLGRNTPHGTLFGFLQAAQASKYKEATQYLQLSKMERASGENLVRQLHELMDDTFVGRIGAVSENEEGSPQAGVPQNRERIGVFRVNGHETNVDLVRVSDPAAGRIWLFSSATLAEVPKLSSQIEESKLESRLPRFLVTSEVLNTPLWRWIAFLLLIPLALALSWATMALVHYGLRVSVRRGRHPVLWDFYDSLKAPARLILTVIYHWIGVASLGFPILFREYYRRVAGIILAAGLAWMIFKLINRWGERARASALAGSGYRNGSIVLLGQRILKVLVLVIAVLIALSILGFNMTTAVAGLGIGSLAIAFAAQKTLENLLGGISILGDEVIRVGDTCRIGEKVGRVQDISLRSTRVRTLDSTELSVPNGQLANMNIENLSRYDKNSLRTTIELQRETSADQLRSLLAQLRSLLSHHPKVDRNVARVHLIGFGDSSLNVEIYCLILTGNWNEFLAIREDLLLQVMDVLAQAGIALAFPSRSLYMPQDQDAGHPPTAVSEQKTVQDPVATSRRRTA